MNRGKLLILFIIFMIVLSSVFFGCDPIDGVELYTLVVNTNPENSGYVKISPNQTVYKENEVVTLTAENTDEYIFDEWAGDADGNSNSITIVMDGNKEITALYNAIIIEHSSITVSTGSTDIPNGADPGYQFSDMFLDDPVRARIFTITNNGDSIINIDNISFVEGDISEFYLNTNNLIHNLNPGDSTTFDLSFTPTSHGSKSVWLNIESNDTDNPEYLFTIRGKVLWEPLLEVSINEQIISSGHSVNFPETDVDFQSGEVILNIANKGKGDLSIEMLEISGTNPDDFIMNIDTPLRVLKPEQSMNVSFAFAPVTEGTKNANFGITSNDPDNGSFNVILFGEGNGYPEIEVIVDTKSITNGENPAYDYGSWMFHGWTEFKTFTIRNSGSSTIQLFDIETSGLNRLHFFYDFTEVDYVLAPGEETYIHIAFIPIYEDPYLSTNIHITSTDRDDPEFIFTLIGNGTALTEPEIGVMDDYGADFKYIADEADPGYDFGTIDVGESLSNEFSVINHGHHLEDLVVSNVEITGEDADQFKLLNPIHDSVTLKWKEILSVPVSFVPTRAGNIKANLVIHSNDTNEAVYNFTLVGFGMTYSSIMVKDSAENEIINNSTISYMVDPLDSAMEMSHSIYSVGEKPLEVNDVSLITDYPDNFSLYVSATPAPHAVLSYNITFNSNDTGTKIATLIIDNNDAMNNPFEYDIEIKSGEYSDIDVTDDNGIKIDNESGIVDFGDVFITTTENKTLMLNSTGTLSLNIDSIELIGTDADQFNIILDEIESEIEPEDSNPFYIEFNPTSDGIKEAMVLINNDSLYNSSYVFTIKGNSIPAPDITIENDGTPVYIGNTYDFGNLLVDNEDKTRFDIRNIGNNPLYISEVLIDGADADQFAIDDFYLETFVEPNKSTEFSIIFAPTTYGVKEATISLLSSDPDENPFTFTVRGTGFVNSGITVSYNDRVIENGSQTGLVFSDTMFGDMDTALITIENNGGDTLSIFDILTENGDATQFIINDESTSTQIGAGESSTVELVFAPTSIGYKSSLLVINNNDSDNDPYVFVIRGNSPGPIDEYVPFPGDHSNLIDWQDLIISYIGDDDLQWFDDNGDANYLTISGDLRIWATFVHEEAGYKNRFGYFAFNEAPAGPVSEEERITIYENASAEGSGGDLLIGDSLYLGQFNDEDRSNIGFWTHQDGHRYPNNPYWWSAFDEGTYGVDAGQWNEDSYRHMVMFVDKHQHAPGEKAYVMLGMEDLTNLGDRDFDDLVIVLTIEPVDPTQSFEDIVDTSEMLSIDDLRNYLNSK